MKLRRKLIWMIAGALVLLAALLLLDGRIVAQIRFTGIPHRPSFDRDFSRLTALLPVGKSSIYQIYRGLAHPYHDKEEFTRELWRTPNRSILGYRFQDQQETLSQDLRDRMASVLGNPDSYHHYLGPKLCGGYHADFAVMLGGDGKERWMLVCLGCSEVLIRSDDGEVICDLEPLAEILLEEIWSEHLGEPYKLVASRLPLPTEVLEPWGLREYTRSYYQQLPDGKPRIAPDNIRKQTVYSVETEADSESPRFIYSLREETFAKEGDAVSRVEELNGPERALKSDRQNTSWIKQSFAIGPRVYVISAQEQRGGTEIAGFRDKLVDYCKSADAREQKQFE